MADVCIAVCDGLKGLRDTINSVGKLTTVQACILHLIRNTFRYASRKYWDQISHDLRPVYTTATEAEAAVAADRIVLVVASPTVQRTVPIHPTQ